MDMLFFQVLLYLDSLQDFKILVIQAVDSAIGY